MLLIEELKAAVGLTNIFFIASLAGKRVDAGPDIGCGGGDLLAGFESCEMVLSHLKAILTSVCLTMLVIFLICGNEKVNVAHFVCLLWGVDMEGFVWEMFRCILSLSLVNIFMGMLLLCAMCRICFHLMRCCSAFSRRGAFS